MTRRTAEDRADLYERSKTINELRSELSDRNLDTSGGKRELAERLAMYQTRRHSRGRRGGDVDSVSGLMVGDRLTNKWSQTMEVVRVLDGVAYAEHDRRSSKAGQVVELTDSDVREMNVRTAGDTKRFWDGYSGEAGYRKM